MCVCVCGGGCDSQYNVTVSFLFSLVVSSRSPLSPPHPPPISPPHPPPLSPLSHLHPITPSSQDKLGQLETDCTHIEEELLGRQIQLETAGHPASELDTEATLTEHQRLQQARDDLQTVSDVLLSVLNVFFLQVNGVCVCFRIIFMCMC